MKIVTTHKLDLDVGPVTIEIGHDDLVYHRNQINMIVSFIAPPNKHTQTAGIHEDLIVPESNPIYGDPILDSTETHFILTWNINVGEWAKCYHMVDRWARAELRNIERHYNERLTLRASLP
jgi:hypothetical protein